MNLNPELYDFRIAEGEGGELNRVYFDSSKLINGGVSGTNGFEIEGESISGLSLNVGSLTGHYFELSASLNFWDNILIRYEGGSDITDLDGNPLFDFTLQYIQNDLDEPTTSNNKYVADGASGSGADIGNPMSIEDAYLESALDTTYHIKAGDYGNVNVSIARSGSVNSPIKFIGYENNPNDNPTLTKSVGMDFDANVMPLLKNSGGSANCITISQKDFNIIKNIQIDSVGNTADVHGIFNDDCESQLIENCYIKNGWRGIGSVNSDSTKYTRIKDCYVADSSQSGIIMSGRNNLIVEAFCCRPTQTQMDYFLLCQGGNVGDHSQAIVDSYVYRNTANDGHNGHGISFKGGIEGKQILHSLMLNCTVEGTNTELRHDGVMHCVMRNVHVSGHTGMVIRDAANYNIVENCSSKNGAYFLRFYETEEPGSSGPVQDYPQYNIIRNCVGENCTTIFEVLDNGNVVGKNVIENNTFENNTFDSCNKVYDRGDTITFNSTNVFTNNIFTNIPSLGDSGFSPAFNYNNGWDYWLNNGQSLNGTGNISVDPLFSPFPIATNPALQAGLLIDGAEYDSEGNQRYAPVTLGSVEIVGDVVDGKVNLTWINSTSPNVTETVIYRDDIEIGRVLVADPSEFTDTNVVIGQTYKYEVQAASPSGESVDEVTGTGGNVVNYLVEA